MEEQMNKQVRISNHTSIGNTNSEKFRVQKVIASIAIVAKNGICELGTKTSCKTNDGGMEL